MVKAELLELVNANKHLYSEYAIDRLARLAGHEIL